MAHIAPFRALRYDVSRVQDPGALLSPPYDVVSESERAGLEANHPHNVIRLELPRGEGDQRYAHAAALLNAWRADGVLKTDDQPAIYAYEQEFRYPAGAGGNTYRRRGFFCRLRLEPFETRVVLPHERTLSGPKEDRRKLMRATRTQLSQVFGLYRDPEGRTLSCLAATESEAPVLDAITGDSVTGEGCRHRLWRLTDPAVHVQLAEALRDRQVMIADGHHRYETMLALRDELRPASAPAGAAAADYACVFLARAEDPGLLVLPTHRMIRDVPGFDLVALRARFAALFDVAEGDESTQAAIEERLTSEGRRRVTFAIRAAGVARTTWLSLRPDADLSALGPPALRGLDVTVLHGLVLGPLLGIDAEAMARQKHLSYTHDTDEALRELSQGNVQAAFFMNATPVHDVLGACEAGFVLPQKSTYFQPKLATGLVMYPVDGLV